MAGYVINALAIKVDIIKTIKEKRKALPPGLINEKAKILIKINRRAY
jgi:hypothetical protein